MERRADWRRDIAAYERGMHMHSGTTDITQQDIAKLKRWLANEAEFVKTYAVQRHGVTVS
jgi:hypothetical protein